MLRTEPYEGIEPILTYPKPERLKAFECPKCGDSALLYPMGHAKCTYQNFTTFLYQVAADGTYTCNNKTVIEDYMPAEDYFWCAGEMLSLIHI